MIYYGKVLLKGLAMGAADVVPGVSGGTIAFISGIYPTLIKSLSGFDRTALQLLRSGQWRGLSAHLELPFLAALLSGIVFSVFALSGIIHHLLNTQPLPVWGFFFGLILASVVFLLRQQPRLDWRDGSLLAAGAAVALAISNAPPLALEPSWPALFGGGALALCAMILPGISGSFILLILGLYPTLVAAFAQRDLTVLALFVSGGITGLLSFSHLLRYLMQRFERQVVATMSGFLLGSLAIIWPWQHPHSNTGVEQHGHLSPQQFAALYGDAQLAVTTAAMVAGLVLLFAVEWTALRGKRRL